ncbi:MAG: PaaI family thioesterase [Caulobacteraceae bacterium]
MDGSEGQAPWTPVEIQSGEWAGWRLWSSDPFEFLAGPFYARETADGTRVCAFRAEAKHMNGGGAMHGGALLTFADYALFVIADPDLEGSGSVTAQLDGQFIDAAREGELIEARGEVVRAAASLIFIRGLVTAAGRPALAFSAIVKKTRRG